MLTLTIDWLSFTIKEMTENAYTFLVSVCGLAEADATTPRHGYTAASTSTTGVLHMWNNDRSEMGHHTVISGRALASVLTAGDISQRALLQQVVNAGANITRLDLAKDARGFALSLTSLWSLYRAGAYRGSARNVAHMESQGNGETIYIGSRQSEKFVRIYNKGAELGNDALNWYRMELETKGQTARGLAHWLLNHSTWGSAFDSMVKGMADVPNSTDFAAFFSDGNEPVGVPKEEKVTDREKWILDQCLPAICKHYAENRTSDAVALLRRTLDLIDRQHRASGS